MIVLGISGLDGAEAFLRARFPAQDKRDYRIAQGYDSAAVLVKDGMIVAAAAEERFTGAKHTGSFPARAMRYVMEECGTTAADIDLVAHGFDFSPLAAAKSFDGAALDLYQEVFSRERLLANVQMHFPEISADRVMSVNHHHAHAASVYYTSGIDEALVVVLDAMGETASGAIFVAKDGQLRRIGTLPSGSSLGVFYSLVTLHLGFEFNADEYKVMGLAPYGDPDRFAGFFREAIDLQPGGSIYIPLLRRRGDFAEKIRYAVPRQRLVDALGRPRMPSDPLEQIHSDIAAGLQQRLEEALLHICGHYARNTGLRRVILAGGVAMNCSANGRLARSGLIDEVYVGPCSGDEGTALGAAIVASHDLGQRVTERIGHAFLGPAISPGSLRVELNHHLDAIDHASVPDLDSLCTLAARAVAAGAVIAWCRGRMEFGARALGNRSIVADPRHPEMRDRINAMVKMREAFRPFAPAVLAEDASRWFSMPADMAIPFMTTVMPVREGFRASLPAVTHVDGSARVQTVDRAGNSDFHRLISAFKDLTGVGMVLNTSFNVKGQPIVRSAAEAIETFLRTGIDALFIHDTLVVRKGERPAWCDSAGVDLDWRMTACEGVGS
jgi:carbamoyltransferase